MGLICIAVVTSAFLIPEVFAQATGLPSVEVKVGESQSPQQVSQSLQVMILLTVLTLAPAIMVMSTAFTRIVIVLSLVRQAMGTPTLPPNQVVVSMALILTFFVMAPTFQTMNDTALQPYFKGTLPQEQAVEKALAPLQKFMVRQTNQSDIGLFVKLAKLEQPDKPENLPAHVLLPAFVISELKTAFQIGFVIFLPFLIIDLVVSSVLVSMGMLFLPPVTVSLPFKIVLFVLVDGWHLLCKALVTGFG